MLTSADVMTADVVSVEPDTPVRDIAQLLYTRRISGVPVVEQGRLIGIVSEGDLIGHAAAIGEQRRSWWLSAFMDDSLSARDYAKTHGRTARDVMTSNVVTVEETTTLAEIAKTLERHRIKRVPVVRRRQTRWHRDTRQFTPGPCDSRGRSRPRAWTIGLFGSSSSPNSEGRLGPICWRTTLSLRTASFVSPGSFSPKMSDGHSALRLRIFRVSKVLRTTLRFGPLHRSEGRPTSSRIRLSAAGHGTGVAWADQPPLIGLLRSRGGTAAFGIGKSACNDRLPRNAEIAVA